MSEFRKLLQEEHISIEFHDNDRMGKARGGKAPVIVLCALASACLLLSGCFLRDSGPVVVRESRSSEEKAEADSKDRDETDAPEKPGGNDASDGISGKTQEADDEEAFSTYIGSLLESYELEASSEGGYQVSVTAPDLSKAVQEIASSGQELSIKNLQEAAEKYDPVQYEFISESDDEAAVQAAFKDILVRTVLLNAMHEMGEEAAE